MSVLVDQEVTRTLSSHLRFAQTALQILLCVLIVRPSSDRQCSTTMSSVALPLSIVLLLLNIAAIAALVLLKVYNRRVFLGVWAMQMAVVSVLMVLGLLEIGETNSCASNRILHRFVGFEALICVIVNVITVMARYDFAVRYTNSPGNMVWPFLFLSFSWSKEVKNYYIFVGVTFQIVTIAMLSSNLVHWYSSFATNLRRAIFIAWVGSLAVMTLNQMVVFICYVSGSNGDSMLDVVAKRLAQVFLFVNVVDAGFWVYGYNTLKIRTGEDIYDQALGVNEREDRNKMV